MRDDNLMPIVNFPFLEKNKKQKNKTKIIEKNFQTTTTLFII